VGRGEVGERSTKKPREWRWMFKFFRDFFRPSFLDPRQIYVEYLSIFISGVFFVGELSAAYIFCSSKKSTLIFVDIIILLQNHVHNMAGLLSFLPFFSFFFDTPL
jgi:hypothetical protein